MTALLTDEQIKKEAARYSNGFGLKDTGHVAQDFAAGAQFAIGIYEARLAELSGRKFLDQPSDLKGIQHEHGCAAFRVDERTGYFSGLPCDCGAQVRWCDLASKRLAEDAKVREQLVEALQDLLAYAESQICSHEETHRGGAIWEICDICGDCWADDDGGKPPRQDPEEIVATRSALRKELENG